MGTSDDVRALQATVVERTASIFEQLSAIAANASTSALGVDIKAEVDLPQIPTVTISAGTAEFTEDTYVSTLYTALLNRLVAEINNGGYGLEAGDESRLFERARERELELVSAAEDEATRLFAAGGFTMPTGASAAARYRAQKEGRDKISSINRELLSKKADLHLQGKGQILQSAGMLEQALQGSFSAKMERRLKKTLQDLQALIEAAIGEGNIQIAAVKAAVDAALGEANLKLEAAKAKAQVFAAVAASGMSGLHVNASLGASAGASESFSGSVNENESLSHNYNHNVE